MMTRDIRATRDRLNLSTEQLAKLVGVSRRQAYRWMDGTRVPTEPEWRLLALIEMCRPMFADWVQSECKEALDKLIFG